jgi:hypothetical protein
VIKTRLAAEAHLDREGAIGRSLRPRSTLTQVRHILAAAAGEIALAAIEHCDAPFASGAAKPHPGAPEVAIGPSERNRILSLFPA